jgi:CMP-N,N'-diacetyllegionaminic acid synthase
VRTLAIVPARSGSKGLPGKNVRDFCGKPLMVWAIDVGLRTCNAAMVSTDSMEYMDLASGCGAIAVLRPLELAQDDTPTLPVVQHALRMLIGDPPDVVVLLQPTAPLRTRLHVLRAMTLMEQTGADSVVSVVEIPAHISPDSALEIERWGSSIPGKVDSRLGPFMGTASAGYLVDSDLIKIDDMPKRRQDCRKAYSRDGTVYVTRREIIERGSLYGDHCVPLIIPPHESCNIDTEEDWQRAEAMMRARQ